MAPGYLQEVLAVLRLGGTPPPPELLVGLGAADDAAVYRLGPDLAIVETVDFFPPVVDDPWTWGAVAAVNAMSDVYAMGGEVMFALAVAGFPREMAKPIISEVFRGGRDKVGEAGGVIAGGHTVVDAEPKYGLCVTGRVHPDRVLVKGGLRPGDRVFLSKPLGTGATSTRRSGARSPSSRRCPVISPRYSRKRRPPVGSCFRSPPTARGPSSTRFGGAARSAGKSVSCCRSR